MSPPLLRHVLPLNEVKHFARKDVYDESANFIDNYAVHFEINGPSHLTEMLPVNVMEVMVSRFRLPNTRDYLAPGICSLIKHSTMEKLMPVPTKIPTMITHK